MIVKTVTYEDLNGDDVTEDFHFHLSKLELLEMDAKLGGLEKVGEQIGKSINAMEAYDLFKGLLLDAYGIKSEDGRKFRKSPEIRADLEHSDALGEIILELLAETDKAVEFFQKLLPAKMVKQIKEEEAKGGSTEAPTAPELPTAAPVVSSEPAKTEELTDEELLKMKPQDMTKEQLQRAFALKTA